MAPVYVFEGSRDPTYPPSDFRGIKKRTGALVYSGIGLAIGTPYPLTSATPREKSAIGNLNQWLNGTARPITYSCPFLGLLMLKLIRTTRSACRGTGLGF